MHITPLKPLFRTIIRQTASSLPRSAKICQVSTLFKALQANELRPKGNKMQTSHTTSGATQYHAAHGLRNFFAETKNSSGRISETDLVPRGHIPVRTLCQTVKTNEKIRKQMRRSENKQTNNFKQSSTNLSQNVITLSTKRSVITLKTERDDNFLFRHQRVLNASESEITALPRGINLLTDPIIKARKLFIHVERFWSTRSRFWNNSFARLRFFCAV